MRGGEENEAWVSQSARIPGTQGNLRVVPQGLFLCQTGVTARTTGMLKPSWSKHLFSLCHGPRNPQRWLLREGIRHLEQQALMAENGRVASCRIAVSALRPPTPVSTLRIPCISFSL